VIVQNGRVKCGVLVVLPTKRRGKGYEAASRESEKIWERQPDADVRRVLGSILSGILPSCRVGTARRSTQQCEGYNYH